MAAGLPNDHAQEDRDAREYWLAATAFQAVSFNRFADEFITCGPVVGSAQMWLLGLIFRTLFIVVLVVMTVRVATPQMETVWSSYETPADLLRIVLGALVCLWLAFHVFQVPKDPGVFRTWLYLGPVLIPLALLCAIVIW